MLLQDLRYALRRLRQSPAFTFVVVLMLALGIGANTAVFSVMNAILLQLLPVSHPEGLTYVSIGHDQVMPPGASNTGDGSTSFSLPAFEALRQRSDVFDALIGYVPLSLNGNVAVRLNGALPEEAEGEEVSGNFFSGLGVRLEQGRGFSMADERSHASIAVISYDYWTRSFARDPDVVGRTIFIKGSPFTVVGISARGFKGVEPAVSTDFWIPLQNRVDLNAWGMPSANGASINTLYSSPRWWALRMMARLKAGVTAQQAQQALAGTFGEVAQQGVGKIDPKQWQPVLAFTPARGIAGFNEAYREPVQILMGLVAMVLLIACTNVAMMLQTRAANREKEFGLRLAMGAGRGSLFRQLLWESGLLVTAGALLGWAFALGVTQALASWSGIESGLSPDRTVLLFTLGISAVAAFVFGLVPLWSAMRAPVAGVLRSTAQNATQRRSRVLGGRVVLAAQMAICLVLLMAAGLLLRTLRNYADRNLGMNTQGLVVFGITPQSQLDAHAFYRSLLQRVRQLPGVTSVSMVENRPGSGWSNNNDLVLDGVEQKEAMLRSNDVGAGFFHTMGVPILAGRDFAESDTQTSQRVAVVNETLVKRYLPKTNPIGHHLGAGKDTATIVGVVRDSAYTSVRETPMPMAYFPAMQGSTIGTMHIEVRSQNNAESMIPVLRKTVAEAYPNIPLEEPMTQQEQFDKSYVQQRMFAAMGGFFGVLAAFLVATGLYGMHSFRVSRRTAEIGVRMALGANRTQVLLMVLSESLWILLAGLLVGIPLTYFAVRPLKSMLYEMSPLDPVSFVSSIAAMILVSMCAALIPARRAATVDPMRALRTE
ncbi:MAG TPA: ABC transporter permease [Terracidiphilus sp.]|jgi:predicted permease|nr:ABC transporter permease [Terracidiphilus sp.]